MATVAENIRARIQWISEKLVEMNSDQVIGAGPDTNGGGGTHIEQVAYRMSLIQEMGELQKVLETSQHLSDDAFEVTSEAYA